MQRETVGVIRRARSEDAIACGEIAVLAWQRVFDAYLEMLGPELFAQLHTGWENRKREQVVPFIEANPDHAIVTDVDGVVAGFLTFHVLESQSLGEIGNNAVHPDWQGHGIGARQCERVLALFRQLGLAAATVQTGLDDGHGPARSMYVKAGFDHSTPNIRYYMKL